VSIEADEMSIEVLPASAVLRVGHLFHQVRSLLRRHPIINVARSSGFDGGVRHLNTG
jgi:hypothetical protein